MPISFALKALEKMVFHDRLLFDRLFYAGQCTVQRNVILSRSAFSNT